MGFPGGIAIPYEVSRRPCLICGSAHEAATLYRLSEDQVLRCAACGLTYLDYSLGWEAYRRDQQANAYERYLVYPNGLEAWLAGEALRVFERAVGGRHEKGRVLDLGCGRGDFLARLRGGPFDGYGVELSEENAGEARQRGLEVQAGFLGDAGFPDGFFRVVTLWSVIEHLHDPLVELLEIQRVLEPGGLLVVQTPNRASLLTITAEAVYRMTLGAVKGPLERFYNRSHIVHYSEETLGQLLNRAGLVPRASWWDERYLTRCGLEGFSLPMRLALQAAARLGRSVGRDEQLFMVAEKAEGCE